MKNFVFSVIWSSICSLLIVWGLHWMMPSLLDSHTVRTVIFIILTGFLWLSGGSKVIGTGIFYLIGLVICLVIGGLLCWGGYVFFSWMITFV